MMDVVCPQCNATHRIPDKRIPVRGAVLTCKRCSTRITVKGAAPVPAAARGAGPHPPTPEAVKAPDREMAAEVKGHYPQLAGYDASRYDLNRILKAGRRGKIKTRRNTFKLKLLDAAKPAVDRLLHPNEQVIGVASGLAYYPLELILGNGWLTSFYNRYVLVATDRRLVAVHTNYRIHKPMHYLFQFPYAEIKKVSRGLLGTSLVMTRKGKRKKIFMGIKRALALELKKQIDARIDAEPPTDESALAGNNLCPACFTALPDHLTGCTQCGAEFKPAPKAALRSLLLPGWGDIYLGHRLLGAVELIGALMVWLFALSLIWSSQRADVIFGALLLVLFNGLDGLLTLHMGRKGYILEKHRSPQKAAVGQPA